MMGFIFWPLELNFNKIKVKIKLLSFSDIKVKLHKDITMKTCIYKIYIKNSHDYSAYESSHPEHT